MPLEEASAIAVASGLLRTYFDPANRLSNDPTKDANLRDKSQYISPGSQRLRLVFFDFYVYRAAAAAH